MLWPRREERSVSELIPACPGRGTVQLEADGEPPAENPRHCGLLTAAASGFHAVQLPFVEQTLEEMEATELGAAAAMKAGARLLYLRARDYGLQAWD